MLKKQKNKKKKNKKQVQKSVTYVWSKTKNYLKLAEIKIIVYVDFVGKTLKNVQCVEKNYVNLNRKEYKH